MASVIRLLAFPILLAVMPAASANPAFETKAICRTAIAVVMDRDPKSLQAQDAPDGAVVLTYARPFDNFVFAYRCRIEGDHVVPTTPVAGATAPRTPGCRLRSSAPATGFASPSIASMARSWSNYSTAS